MSNESVNQDVKQESVVDNVKNPTVNQDDKQNMIPQARFSEHVAKTNAKMEELTSQLDSYKAKEETARKKRLEEEGNFKQLIAEQESELSTLRTYKSDMDTKVAEKRKELINQLPEDQRTIYGELSVDALEKHINMSNANMNKVPTNTQQPKRVGNQEFGGLLITDRFESRGGRYDEEGNKMLLNTFLEKWKDIPFFFWTYKN